MTKHHLTLAASDVSYLTDLLGCGTLPVKTCRRAQALLWLHAGQGYTAVARALQVRYGTVSKWATCSRTGGQARLAFLHEAPRSGRPIRFDGVRQAKLVALACSPAPHGYARWSVRLLADRAVEPGLDTALSKSQVQRVLKKTSYSPTAKGSGV